MHQSAGERVQPDAGDGDAIKAWLRSNVPHVGRELIAGGAAGAIAKTCVAPLERTKILLMTGKATNGAVATLSALFRSEGLPGLFRGNGASCLRIVPYAAIHFSAYEAYRRLLAEQLLPLLAPAAAPLPATAAARDSSAGGGGSSRSTAEEADGSGSGRSGSVVLDAAEDEETGSLMASANSIDISSSSLPPPPSKGKARLSPARAPGVASVSGSGPAGAEPPRPKRLTLVPGWELLAGSAAGATAVLMTYPLDVVRTRLAWATEASAASAKAKAASAVTAPAPAAGAGPPASTATLPATAPARQVSHRITGVLRDIVRHDGPVGLYRGLAPTLYGIMPYAGLKFFVYASLKQRYRDAHGGGGDAAGDSGGGGKRGGGDKLPVPYMLAFGGASGLLAQTVTYPLDVVRRRMQVYGLQQEQAGAARAGAAAAGRLSTWGTAAGILQREGLRGLFRGLSLNYVKVVPSTAIGFTTYDLFKSYLGVSGGL
ncbi:hypothetical protein GPECTOR_23g52 [Gonium pectorale]|uniref:Uncharacterized protein n=1 Tax=Gonium pectorale TaxID=33097 RepID=A0A150GH57_GONPE|nr:hypothetical protein GPECTOR_23g52 [Gonium pectorale]|eukprot:KXZ49123.1 hypothetical protein GPECTOR_23g52 [Gonium pectorale]